LEAARRRGPARAAPSRRRGQPDPGPVTRYFPDNHAAGVQYPRDQGWAGRWEPEPHPRRKGHTNSDPGGGPQAAGGGRERLPAEAEKEARRLLLVVQPQVIFLGWLFYSSEVVYNLSDAPPHWSGSGWSVGSAGRLGRKGHTDPDPDDGPQAARRPESRRKPAAPALALPTGAGKEASRRLLLVVQQVIFLGWLFHLLLKGPGCAQSCG
jgi:hypothetical protein